MKPEKTNRNSNIQKILVAENDESNREYIELLLLEIDHKFQITYAQTGSEVIDLYKQNTYDIIIMNIVIPQITGFTATKIIRKTDKIVLIIAQSSILEHSKIFQKHLKY